MTDGGSASSERSEDEPRAWGWVAHLREGGTTPWADWSGAAERGGRFLPGAQQLELVRRLNLATGGSVDQALAMRVLEASAPGRGRPDLQLVGAARESAFGPRPVDPADLPADELVRVATSVIAEDVAGAGLPAERPAPLTRPWRRPYRLVGDPVLADPLRAQLIARGRPPGGGGARILVLGRAVDEMLADAFEARALDGGGPSWGDWLDVLSARDELAPRIDLAQVARTWARRTSTERVIIVLDAHRVARLVGVRRLAVPEPLSADAVDLARRVAAVLGLLVTQERRAALLQRTLAPRLRTVPGPRLAVPEPLQGWVSDRAERMRRQLRRGGYPVLGSGGKAPEERTGGVLDAVLPAYAPGGVEHVGHEGVLRVAIDLVLGPPRRPEETT